MSSPDLTGYVIAELRPDAIVIKRPWPELPFGTDPRKTIAEDRRRWAVRFVDGAIVVEEIAA